MACPSRGNGTGDLEEHIVEHMAQAVLDPLEIAAADMQSSFMSTSVVSLLTSHCNVSNVYLGLVEDGVDERSRVRDSAAQTPKTATASQEGADAEGVTSAMAASMNLITIMIGAGVLGFPKLFSRVGIWIGSGLLIFCCLTSMCLCNIVAHTIAKMDARLSQQDPKSKRIVKMDDLGQACFGKSGEMATRIIVNALYIGNVSCFLVLIGQNMKFLMDFLAYRAWILVMVGLMLPVAFLRDVSVVARMGILGVVASVIYFVTIVGASVQAYQASAPGGFDNPLPQPTIATCLSVLTTMMFGFGPAHMLPAVRRDMKNPEELPKALGLSHAAAGLIYLTAGVVGFWGFGQGVDGNISRSMCDAPGCPGTLAAVQAADHGLQPGNRWGWGIALAIAVIMNIMVTIPIVLYCLFTGIESLYPKNQPMSTMAGATMRVSVVVVTGSIALFVPFFLEVLGIISAVLVVPAVFVFPICFGWKAATLCGEPHGPLRILLNLFGLLLASALFVIGLIEAVRALSDEIAKNPDAANPFSRGFFAD